MRGGARAEGACSKGRLTPVAVAVAQVGNFTPERRRERSPPVACSRRPASARRGPSLRGARFPKAAHPPLLKAPLTYLQARAAVGQHLAQVGRLAVVGPRLDRQPDALGGALIA